VPAPDRCRRRTEICSARSVESILYQYSMHPTTWVYLSSILTIALFFKFNRFWSFRNLDLVGLIALAPGLLLVAEGKTLALEGATVVRVGYVWLFTVGLLFMVRLLSDPMMVRRPLLEPNLSTGGMTFIGLALFVFLMANVITKKPSPADLEGPRMADDLIGRVEAPPDRTGLARFGPGYPLLHLLPRIPSKLWEHSNPTLPPEEAQQIGRLATARTMAIASHLAIVIGLILIGYRHFQNIRTGVALATLYLLLPYTAQMTGRVDHVLPAALLVWAVEAYRRPLVSGMFLGLAIGTSYYPVFLLPLWLAFYWQRGWLRFLIGAVTTVAILVSTLAFTSADLEAFLAQTRMMFGWSIFSLDNVEGFWDVSWAAYRITVFAAFAALSLSLVFWPAQKNLGTLLSCSAAVMLGTQFWQAQEGGLYMAWYLPLLMLTIFRPNLEDRLAVSALDQSWFEKRRAHLRRVDQAA
jgi:hypothetical protein